MNFINSSLNFWLTIISCKLLLLGTELLFVLLLTKFNQCIFENVFGHGCSIEFETLMSAVYFFERLDLNAQFIHFFFYLILFFAFSLLEKLFNVTEVISSSCLQNAQSSIFLSIYFLNLFRTQFASLLSGLILFIFNAINFLVDFDLCSSFNRIEQLFLLSVFLQLLHVVTEPRAHPKTDT